MPPLVAAAAVSAAGALVGGGVSAHAAGTASRAAGEAADRAAAREADAAGKAERFQRQQAEDTYRQSETDRRGNYDQWRARETRLGSIAEQLGYGARQIPDYVPGVDPHFDVPTVASAAGATSPAGPPPVPPGPPPAGYVAPATLPTYAQGTGADGLTARSASPATANAAVAPPMPPPPPTGTLAMPGPESIADILARRQRLGLS